MTGDGVALAATAIVGGSLTTVTSAVPESPDPESLAVTVNGPPLVAAAVNSPAPSIDPPPFTAHENVGCDAIGSSNWSRRDAANPCVAFWCTVAKGGATVTVAAVWVTVTVTESVAVRPPWSVTVTWNVYMPAWLKVASAFFAAFVPFGLMVTGPGPAVTTQV